MNRIVSAFAVVLALVFCLGASQASAREVPVVTGEHWVKSTEGERKAFLLGAATIIALEYQVQNGQPEADKTLVDTWVPGLTPYTLADLVKGLDDYYKNNPDKLNRPVIEVLWTEFALPKVYKK